MKKWITTTLLAVLFLPALASATEVSPAEYRRIYGRYGKSDGPFQRLDTNCMDWFIDGHRGPSIGKCVYEDFSEYGDGDDSCVQADWTGCAATGANLIMLPSGNILASFAIVGQTVPGGVDMDAGSLDIAGDQTDNDGLELAWGTHGASGRPFTVGDDPAFYTCATVTVADVSGTDDFHIGFRVADDGDGDAGGFNATFDNYHDLAAIGPISGNVTISTIAADAATSETDTTADLADAGSDRYCVYVSAAGVVTFTIDGNAPPTTATYTFTDAETVIPFIHLLQASDLTGEVDLTEWEVGYQ
jgi:hypothetical protein